MNPSLEIRKLPVSLKSELIAILELQESWKKLMAIIPKMLCRETYKCDVDLNNPAKYRSEHFRLIENHSIKNKKNCSEILLYEWGTSGKVRPTLAHLTYLLEKAELYRAADYVTMQILKQEPPKRPVKGPSAPVMINSSELKDTETERIEKILDQINYPSSAIEDINKMSSINTNLNYSAKDKPKEIPKIIISESPDPEEIVPSFSVPVVIQNERVRSTNNKTTDLIKFSSEIVESESDNSSPNLPMLSALLTKSGTENSVPNNNIPLVLGSFSSSSSENQSDNDVNIPQISALLSDKSTEDEEFNLPNLSGLSASSSEQNTNLPAFSQLIAGSSEIALPQKSSNESLHIQTNLKPSSSKSSSQSRCCTSPLPNLSLNTLLPHFTYTELEFATNNFDETPLTQSGRFLGSGAFGKVYLAVGLFDKPVAIKKLLLENVDVVLIDDTVTKQFRNEVEVLSKYKHDNLLSLLGYSCDGPTYCLMYEYIPGGALKERLQKHEKLIWTERLYIAIGTAKAISYLHTAFATPLIHRDVKTANILLDFTNKPKLCDFGLIKLAPNQNTTTGTTIFGTSAYMAPEAFRGDISVKLDTFSFGVVLLELLTALPPTDENREGVDLVTHVDDVCERDVQLFLEKLLDLSAGNWIANDINFGEQLYTIAMQCLEEKKKRPTMVQVNDDLDKFVQKSLMTVNRNKSD